MAITFPLSLSDFFDGLRLTQMDFDLGEALQHSGQTGNGEILPASAGTRLWEGAVHVAPETARQLDKVINKIDLLRDANGSFMIGDDTHTTLENDPDGVVAQANTVTVQSVSANLKELSIQGMPGGFQLEDGDQFSIDHGDGTFSYYRIAAPVAFDAGFTPPRASIELRPHLSIKVAAGMSVALYKPALKANYLPQSYSGGTRKPNIADGVSFRWRQTLL